MTKQYGCRDGIATVMGCGCFLVITVIATVAIAIWLTGVVGVVLL